MKRKVVSVIIPAYNEAEFIYETLINLKFTWIKEIIVVDDGSTDDTYLKAKECLKEAHNISLFRFSKNKGKGEAVTYGLDKAEGDIILLIDADLGKSVVEAEKLVIPIFKNKAQITIGELPIIGGGIGAVRKGADLALKLITGREMKAPLSGQRAFKRDVIKELIPFSSGFGLEIGMDIDIIAKNYRYQEIFCNFQHNVSGHSPAGYRHRFKQFRDILKTSMVKGYQLKGFKKIR